MSLKKYKFQGKPEEGTLNSKVFCLYFIQKFRLYSVFQYLFEGFFIIFSSYYIQHYFICRPSDSIVPTDAGIEPRTVATGALAARRSNH